MSRNAVENTGYSVELNAGRDSRGLAGLIERISPKKVRTKILLLFALLIAAMSAFLATTVPGLLNRNTDQEARQRLDTVTGLFAIGLSSGLTSGDPVSLQAGLQNVCDLADEILYAVLETEGGEITAAVNRDLADQLAFRDAVTVGSDFDLRQRIRLRMPLVSSDGGVGTLYLGLSFESLFASVRKDRLTVVSVSLATLVVGVLFILLISTQITRPLAHLSRTADRISRGDLKQRAKISSRDEVGQLAESFNGMMDQMEKSFHDLEDRTRRIEGRVSSKTIDLEQEVLERRRVERELRLATNELEKRVNQRTMELSQVNKELHGKMLETRRVEGQLQTNLGRMERALEGISRAMSQTVEIRDLYAAGHHRRVSNLAVAIAKEMHLPSDKVEGLRLAGIIHDIGKIAVPLEILTKPARLSQTETQIIRDHPKTGFEILKSIDFPWPVAHIILQHHERLDGSGYPEGLIGDAILLEARILAVADVVEACCSRRSYRDALGLEKAMDEIQKGRGTRYDAAVVDACVKIFREKRFFFDADNETDPGH